LLAGEYEHTITLGTEFKNNKKRGTFLADLDGEGDITWKTQIGAVAPADADVYTTVSSLTIAGANRFYVTGGFRGTLEGEVSIKNSKDAYIALYQWDNAESGWKQSWLEKAGHNHEDNLHLKRYTDGKLFISGFFSNAFDLGTVAISGKNYKDLFVGKFIDCPPIPGPVLEDITICEGESVTLDAGAGYTTYEWINISNESIGIEQTIAVTLGGTYTVKVTDAIGCGSGSTVITVAPATATNLIEDQSSCSNVELTAPANYASYSWENGPFSEIATTYTAIQTGIVQLTVKDNMNNCFYDDIQVTINNGITVNLEPNTALCEGESTTLDAGAGYTSYEWTNSANEIIGTDQTLMISTADTYSVTVIDATGCGSASTEVTVFHAPYFDFPATTWIQADYLLDPGLSGDNYSYSWNNGESTESTFLLIFGRYGRASYVNLVVTEINGCGSHEDQTLVRQGTPPPSIAQEEENNDNTTTELEEIEEPLVTAYKVYPNPTDGRFYINVSHPEKVMQVHVIGLKGNVIKTIRDKFTFRLR